jgi:hypothetical protein
MRDFEMIYICGNSEAVIELVSNIFAEAGFSEG